MRGYAVTLGIVLVAFGGPVGAATFTVNSLGTKLKASRTASRIALRGSGRRLRRGRLPLVAPVRAILKRSEGPSWGASFAAPATNGLQEFKATSN